MLLRGYDTLSAGGRARLEHALATDDPTGELGAAWSVKEALRLILTSHTLQEARAAKARFNTWVTAADTDETDRFAATITAWWPAIEVYITTRRHERPDRSCEHRDQAHQAHRSRLPQQRPLPARILLHSAHQARGNTP